MEKIKLSPLELDPSCPIRRTMPRPANMRQPDYEDEFDFLTIFYDCFRSVDQTWCILLGPPFLNLESIVLPALPTLFRCHPSSDVLVRHLDACAELWLRTVESSIELPPGVFRQDKIIIQPNQCDLFNGRRVLITKSKDNDLRWIYDWVHFFARKHGSDAVLLYDNASTKYEISEIHATISSIPGIEVAVVVPWPYKFGPIGSKSFFPGQQGARGKVIEFGEWDSTFCQYGILQHARHRFLSLAEAVVNADVDELILTKNSASVFELVSRSYTGYLQYLGHWIETATETNSKSCRHFDFVYSKAQADVTRPKWTDCAKSVPVKRAVACPSVSRMQPDALSARCQLDIFARSPRGGNIHAANWSGRSASTSETMS